eukprot:COSAG05_NODE_11517_length_509_cov_1.504878_1_plen_54_part_10
MIPRLIGNRISFGLMIIAAVCLCRAGYVHVSDPSFARMRGWESHLSFGLTIIAV